VEDITLNSQSKGECGMYRAVFFDRDGTLTFNNPVKTKWRDQIVSEWSNKPFSLSYERMMGLFEKAGEGKRPWYRSIDDEKAFMRRYYYYLLEEEGIKDNIEKRAELLFTEMWCNNDRLLFPEAIEVLEYFKEKGYKMGVISDTSPSLQYTLEQHWVIYRTEYGSSPR
jgi:putative hydrolase of the HAD superfamily